MSPDFYLLVLTAGERRRQLLQGLSQTLPETLPFLYNVSIITPDSFLRVGRVEHSATTEHDPLCYASESIFNISIVVSLFLMVFHFNAFFLLALIPERVLSRF